MGKSLSNNLRMSVVESVLAGSSRRQVSTRLGAGVSSAIRWVRSWHERGVVPAKPQSVDRRSGWIEAHADFLVDQVAQTPDVTLEELQAVLRARVLTSSARSSREYPNRDRHQSSLDAVFGHRDSSPPDARYERNSTRIRCVNPSRVKVGSGA